MDNSLLRVSYGSQARGEQDYLSDIDILEVCGEGYVETSSADPRISISRYSWDEFERMAAYGSLFLLHLRMEGEIIRGSAEDRARYLRVLTNLSSYKLADRDLRSFEATLEDVESAIRIGDSSVEFELGTLATVIRHASVLGCYLIGRPNFGRYNAVQTFVAARPLAGVNADSFPELYMYRLAAARNFTMPAPPEPTVVVRWIENARKLITEVRHCA